MSYQVKKRAEKGLGLTAYYRLGTRISSLLKNLYFNSVQK